MSAKTKTLPYYSSEPYKTLPAGAAHDDHPLTTKAVAALLGMSEVWLANLRSAGKGPRFIRVGTRVYYSSADVDQWKSSVSVDAPAVRVVGDALSTPEETLAWYCPEPEMDYAGSPARERVFRVDLPRELATVANGGIGYLVLAPEAA